MEESPLYFRQLANTRWRVGKSAMDFCQLSWNNINIGYMLEVKLMLLEYMSELRSYCTVAFPTRKLLYLNFYSTNFNNFFFKYSLESILLTVKIWSLLAAVATEFSNKKGQRSVFLAVSTYKNHLSVPQFWLDENSFLQPFCSQDFPLSGNINWSQLRFRLTDQILQKLPKHTLWPFYARRKKLFGHSQPFPIHSEPFATIPNPFRAIRNHSEQFRAIRMPANEFFPP
jgi:hypothetical protein